VLAPVEVTVPYQISTSLPSDPWNCDAFFHVVTPPPEIDDTERVWPMIPTTITSPMVLGDTARVVRAVPWAETRLPTAVIEAAGAADEVLAKLPTIIDMVAKTSVVRTQRRDRDLLFWRMKLMACS